MNYSCIFITKEEKQIFKNAVDFHCNILMNSINVRLHSHSASPFFPIKGREMEMNKSLVLCVSVCDGLVAEFERQQVRGRTAICTLNTNGAKSFIRHFKLATGEIYLLAVA